MTTVVRYVITHVGRHGLRTLAEPQQGRFTYATHEEAQKHLDAMLAANSSEYLQTLFGFPLEVRACKCWAGHFDPVGIYFDTEGK